MKGNTMLFVKHSGQVSIGAALSMEAFNCSQLAIAAVDDSDLQLAAYPIVDVPTSADIEILMQRYPSAVFIADTEAANIRLITRSHSRASIEKMLAKEVIAELPATAEVAAELAVEVVPTEEQLELTDRASEVLSEVVSEVSEDPLPVVATPAKYRYTSLMELFDTLESADVSSEEYLAVEKFTCVVTQKASALRKAADKVGLLKKIFSDSFSLVSIRHNNITFSYDVKTDTVSMTQKKDIFKYNITKNDWVIPS